MEQENTDLSHKAPATLAPWGGTRLPLTLRASFAPIACKCAAAAVPPSVVIVGDSEDARLGSAIHQALAVLAPLNISNGSVSQTCQAAARRWQVEAEAVEPLVRWALKRWHGTPEEPGIRQWFPDPVVEKGLTYLHPSGLQLSGHPDVAAAVPGAMHVCDWKTGHGETDYADQMRVYGLLLLNQHHDAGLVRAFVVRFREQAMDVDSYEREELDAWAWQMAEHLRQVERYHPGKWCGFCPRRWECPAVMAVMRQTHRELTEEPKDLLARLPVDPQLRALTLVSLHERAKIALKNIERFRDLLRAEIEGGGPLPAGNGMQLQLTQQEQRKLVPAAALDVLLDGYLTHQELHEVMALSKGKVEDVVRAKAGRGQGAAAVRELQERLEQAGAYATTVISKLELKRIPQTTGVLTHEHSSTEQTSAAGGAREGA